MTVLQRKESWRLVKMAPSSKKHYFSLMWKKKKVIRKFLCLKCQFHIFATRTTQIPTHHWLPYGSAGKESACHAGDLGSILGVGRSPGEGKGYSLQYSGLENSMEHSPWGCKQLDVTEWLSLLFFREVFSTEPGTLLALSTWKAYHPGLFLKRN